jgi:hypothetical protein
VILGLESGGKGPGGVEAVYLVYDKSLLTMKQVSLPNIH